MKKEERKRVSLTAALSKVRDSSSLSPSQRQEMKEKISIQSLYNPSEYLSLPCRDNVFLVYPQRIRKSQIRLPFLSFIESVQMHSIRKNSLTLKKMKMYDSLSRLYSMTIASNCEYGNKSQIYSKFDQAKHHPSISIYRPLREPQISLWSIESRVVW